MVFAPIVFRETILNFLLCKTSAVLQIVHPASRSFVQPVYQVHWSNSGYGHLRNQSVPQRKQSFSIVKH
jgi:hypothetical protein